MSTAPTQSKGKYILLVDDDLDDRELFVEAFSYLNGNSQISTLETSENLIGHLNAMEKLPDFLFLDLNMPRKSGKECLKEIQRDERLKKMRVVIYSTSINPKDVTETYHDGAYCFIQKPNSFADLKTILQKVINSESEMYTLDDGYIITASLV
jgi:DNA-binding NtrC family response regulator